MGSVCAVGFRLKVGEAWRAEEEGVPCQRRYGDGEGGGGKEGAEEVGSPGTSG
jgi:hypothetical protein